MKRSTILSFVVAVVGFGILVPWWKGFEFLDATVILACTAVSLVFVAPMTASSFEAKHAKGQVLRAVGFSWLVAFLVLVNGIATVNVRNWLGQLMTPPFGIVLSALILNLSAAFFLGLVTAEIALRTGKPETGVRIVRAGFFLLLAVLVFMARYAPASMRSAFDESMTSAGLIRISLTTSAVLALTSLFLWKRVDTLGRR